VKTLTGATPYRGGLAGEERPFFLPGYMLDNYAGYYLGKTTQKNTHLQYKISLAQPHTVEDKLERRTPSPMTGMRGQHTGNYCSPKVHVLSCRKLKRFSRCKIMLSDKISAGLGVTICIVPGRLFPSTSESWEVFLGKVQSKIGGWFLIGDVSLESCETLTALAFPAFIFQEP
jgi:hypothetical protein